MVLPVYSPTREEGGFPAPCPLAFAFCLTALLFWWIGGSSQLHFAFLWIGKCLSSASNHRAIQVSHCLKPLFMGFISLFASFHWVPFWFWCCQCLSRSHAHLPLPGATWLQLSRILQAQPRHPFLYDAVPKLPGVHVIHLVFTPPAPSTLLLHAYHSILIACLSPSYPNVMLAPWGYRSRLIPWSIFSSYFKGLRWRSRTNICWISEKQTHLWNTFCTSNPHLWVW